MDEAFSNFGLAPRQRERVAAFKDEVRGTLGEDPDLERRDREGIFDRDRWRQAAELGVLRWAVPTARGGDGLDALTAVALMEALGETCRDNGLTFGLGAQMWGVQTALTHFGTEAQIARYLPGSMRGEQLTAYGMTEVESGSDAFGMAATAHRDGASYVLSGEKVYVTFAPVADFAIIFAKTNPDAGRWGISAFLVDADRPGYRAHPVEAKMGLRTVPFGRITLDECRVPVDARLGQEGAGASIFTFSQGWERSLVLAPQVGAMQRQLDACVAFARGRRRGGQAIGRHQAVAHRIATMKLRLETSRLLLYRTASLYTSGKSQPMEGALTKLHLAEAFVESSRDAIAIHGGEGYTSAAGVERDLRDALGGTIYGGTSDIQRNIVAGLLGL